MRFISQYPGFKYQIRPQRQRGLGDGSIEITVEPIYAEFQPVYGGGMIYENEVAAALAHFEFRGNTQEQDEATPSDPTMRLAVFDSDEFAEAKHLTAEEHKLVNDRLTQLSIESPTECLLVMDTPIMAPFPAYDTWDGPDTEMLMAKLIEDGHDLPLVLHYERVFGPKRENIIAALETTIELQKEQTVTA